MLADKRGPIAPARSRRGRPGTRAWLAFGSAFAVVFVVLAVFAASAGIRGTDQYWYLADVETLIRDGATTSDTIFPVGLLGPGGTLSPPFIHNVLSVYLAAVPGLLIGGYGGWIALNVTATLATAALVYLAARTVASRWAAIICAALYPLLPVTFWHATQPLAEASTAFFAALAIFLLAIAGSRPWRWLAVVGAVGLLYFSRESYLPLLLAVPVGFLIVRVQDDPGHLRGALGPTAAMTLAVLAVIASAQVLFPADNVTFSYARLMNTAVPGLTDNMWFNFDLSSANLADRLPFRWDLLPAKVAGHLADQFVRFDSLPLALFYWIFNSLAIVAVAMLWRARHRPAALRLIVAALAVVAIHFLTITLFQNQVRYTVPALPGLLMVLAIALSGVQWLARIVAPRTLTIVILMMLLAVLPTVWLARTQRSEGQEYGAIEQAARELVDGHVGTNGPAMIVYAGSQVLAYATNGRPILYVSQTYTRDEYRRLREAFPAHWLLAPIDSPAVAGLGVGTTEPVGSIEALGVEWGLFQLPD